MTSRNQLFALVCLLLLILSAVLFTSLTRTPEPFPPFAATVKRDCAPWDGPAFSVSIPVEEGTLKISIYQPPDIQHFVRFSFPDETLREGHAMLVLPVDVPETLTGNLSFQRVEQGVPVEGQFDLSTEAGRHFKGAFLAEWGNEIVYCG
jgi:hypothetical protein